MIRGRLKRVQFALNLVVLGTPLAAFCLAGYLRFATRLLRAIRAMPTLSPILDCSF